MCDPSCPEFNELFLSHRYGQLDVDEHVAQCLDMDINDFFVLD